MRGDIIGEKNYSDTFLSMPKLATRQLIHTVRAYVNFWRRDELHIPMTNGTIESREKTMFDMTTEAIVLLKSPSDGTFFISVKLSWFRSFITDVLGDVH